MFNGPPHAPPPPTAGIKKHCWRNSRFNQDETERKAKVSEENVNNEHWQCGSPGKREWSVMKGFDDLMFRIAYLLTSDWLKPGEILVSFDFDGTLGARRSHWSQGRDKSDPYSIVDTHVQEELSAAMLRYLNKLGIPYFVNTAADNPCQARDMMNGSIQMPESTILAGYKWFSTDARSIIEHFGTRLERCGQVMSSRYDKHVPIDYMIHTLNLPTKVIIHVDDGMINLKTVLGAGFSQHVIGMYFPTIDGTIIGTEPNTEEAYEYLSQIPQS